MAENVAQLWILLILRTLEENNGRLSPLLTVMTPTIKNLRALEYILRISVTRHTCVSQTELFT